MRHLRILAAASLAVIGMAHATPSLAQGTVYVVHGIPGDDLGLDTNLPVDVSVNGACALEGFVFGDIVGPLPFEAGSYDIDISLANEAEPCTNDAVISAPGIPVEDGKNYSIVAHLDEFGSPTASALLNDVSRSKLGARVNVAHTAAAPRVDARLKRTKKGFWWLNRMTKIKDIGNGEIATASVYAADYKVSLSPAGSRDRVFGPVPASLDRNTAYGVYAVGSLATGSLTLLVTTLEDAPRDTADVFVVHGIPGLDLGLDPALPVDVRVNGECALPGFTFGEIVGPLALPTGNYDIAIGLANEAVPCSEDAVIEANGIPVEAGSDYSIVAHLTEDGAPTASAFVNDTWANRYFANVNVFHTAAAPRVDVNFQRSNLRFWNRTLRDVGNGEAGSIDLFGGGWNASIRPAGTRSSVFGPAQLDLAPDTVYLVYAVGSLTNGTFTVLIGTSDATDH